VTVSPSPSTPTHHAPDPADLSGLAHDLRLACMRVSRRVRFESAGELAPHHFSVLAQLKDAPTTLGDLADREQVRAPSMTRTVASLVEAELVTRTADPRDGRVALIALTEAGAAMLASERAKRDAWMTARLEGLTSAEQDTLRGATDILERVVAR